MEIIRQTDILVETKRRFVIRQPQSGEPMICAECGESMLAAEATAELFGISRRAVYRLVEKENAHFAETETGAVMICASSFAAVLNNGGAKRISEASDSKA